MKTWSVPLETLSESLSENGQAISLTPPFRGVHCGIDGSSTPLRVSRKSPTFNHATCILAVRPSLLGFKILRNNRRRLVDFVGVGERDADVLLDHEVGQAIAVYEDYLLRNVFGVGDGGFGKFTRGDENALMGQDGPLAAG